MRAEIIKSLPDVLSIRDAAGALNEITIMNHGRFAADGSRWRIQAIWVSYYYTLVHGVALCCTRGRYGFMCVLVLIWSLDGVGQLFSVLTGQNNIAYSNKCWMRAVWKYQNRSLVRCWGLQGCPTAATLFHARRKCIPVKPFLVC